MAISGQVTTYSAPNYHGELFVVTPTDTPFLSAIGGINGAKVVHSKTWEWQTVDRRAGSANNVVAEGAAAPTGTGRSRSNVYNITEIHQSAVEVTYSKMAATGQFSGVNIDPLTPDPVISELQMQIEAELASMALDINLSFLNGTLQVPSSNGSNRQTQGILGAIASSVSANGGTNRALSATLIDGLLKTMYGNGARLTGDNMVFLCGQDQALNISKTYAAQATLAQPTFSRTLGGMAIQTVQTIFGTFGVMIDRSMPAREIAVVDLSVCYPVFTEIPGKGVLFSEPLAKTGSSEKWQIYGEIGLEYGPETYHGLLKDLLNWDGS